MDFVSKVSVSLDSQTRPLLRLGVSEVWWSPELPKSLCHIAAAYGIQHVWGSRGLKDEEAEGNGRLPVEDKKFFRYRGKPFSIELLYLWEAKL